MPATSTTKRYTATIIRFLSTPSLTFARDGKRRSKRRAVSKDSLDSEENVMLEWLKTVLILTAMTPLALPVIGFFGMCLYGTR